MLRYIVFFSALFALSSAHPSFYEKFRWNYINYTWPYDDAYSAAKSDGSYIAKNNIISGIKVWKDKMYLSVPRYKNGVPATLAVTSATALNNDTAPLLKPYPKWKMQKIGDCSAFQNVHNVEIDPKGRMWVLDSGRVATMTPEPHENNCAARLVILDLENGGAVLRSHAFPEDVASRNSTVLKDLAIDHEHGGVAYIADSSKDEPGLIVYSLKNNTSWKVHHQSMHFAPDAVGIALEDPDNPIRFDERANVNGITLSPASTEGGEREVYFSPLSSFEVFAVKTQALIDAKDKAQGDEREKFIGEHIRNLGRKPSQTDGMVMSNTGKLYFGLLADDAVSMWDTRADDKLATGQKIISRDHSLMEWPGSLAFDDQGQLWCITSRMHRYVDNSLDINRPNYRALMSRVDMRNYQYYAHAPEWPDIADETSSEEE